VVNVDLEIWEQRRGEFPLLVGAVARHLSWAWDFTEVGDLDAALDALLDASSVAAELFG
jgi:hypothetical protein